MTDSSLIPRKPMFGMGARICVVLSAAWLLLFAWTYKENLDTWSEYDRCQKIISNAPTFPLPPIQFSVAHGLAEASHVPEGKEMYIACPHLKPIFEDDPLPAACSTFVVAERDDEPLRFLLGPAHATRRQINDAADRLGMNGELSKELADEASRPLPRYSAPETQAELVQCQQRSYYTPPQKPTFDPAELAPLLWIWGIYGALRFIRWK